MGLLVTMSALKGGVFLFLKTWVLDYSNFTLAVVLILGREMEIRPSCSPMASAPRKLMRWISCLRSILSPSVSRRQR